MEVTTREIMEWLTTKGFEPRLMGTTYLAEALYIVLTDDGAKYLSMREIYERIGNMQPSEPLQQSVKTAIERSIAKKYGNRSRNNVRYSNVGIVQTLASEYRQRKRIAT